MGKLLIFVVAIFVLGPWNYGCHVSAQKFDAKKVSPYLTIYITPLKMFVKSHFGRMGQCLIKSVLPLAGHAADHHRGP